jgi:hypothetical protein
MDQPRHEATMRLLRWFGYDHLPPDLQAISQPCGQLAEYMCAMLGDSAELTVGLRKLLEAKDCFVRAAVAQED